MQLERGHGGSGERGTVVVLTKDLLFSVSIRNTVRRLGFSADITKSTDALSDALVAARPALVVVDLATIGAQGDWDTVADAAADGVQVLVFGPHKDVDGLRAAKAAGVARVVSNGQFHREMAVLIERYAAPTAPGAQLEADDEIDFGDMPPGMALFEFGARPSPNDSRQ